MYNRPPCPLPVNAASAQCKTHVGQFKPKPTVIGGYITCSSISLRNRSLLRPIANLRIRFPAQQSLAEISQNVINCNHDKETHPGAMKFDSGFPVLFAALHLAIVGELLDMLSVI